MVRKLIYPIRGSDWLLGGAHCNRVRACGNLIFFRTILFFNFVIFYVLHFYFKLGNDMPQPLTFLEKNDITDQSRDITCFILPSRLALGSLACLIIIPQQQTLQNQLLKLRSDDLRLGRLPDVGEVAKWYF